MRRSCRFHVFVLAPVDEQHTCTYIEPLVKFGDKQADPSSTRSIEVSDDMGSRRSRGPNEEQCPRGNSGCAAASKSGNTGKLQIASGIFSITLMLQDMAMYSCIATLCSFKRALNLCTDMYSCIYIYVKTYR